MTIRTKNSRATLLTFGAAAALMVATPAFAAETDMGHDSMESSLHCQHFPADCADETQAEDTQATAAPADASPETIAMSGSLTEPGQSMFGALSEINKLIEQSGQGWETADFDNLWEHLRDMDALMTGTDVTKTSLDNGLRMVVKGDGPAKRAMDNMLPAHASFLGTVRPAWSIELASMGENYELVVTSTDADEVRRIQALGFSGFMVQDDHHASHHLGLALGEIVH